MGRMAVIVPYQDAKEKVAVHTRSPALCRQPGSRPSQQRQTATLLARARDTDAVRCWGGCCKIEIRYANSPARESSVGTGFDIRCLLVTLCGDAPSRPTLPVLCRPGRRPGGASAGRGVGAPLAALRDVPTSPTFFD